MADTNQAPGSDHDRVVSLSIRSDGSFDQNNPEIIGDKEAALEFTKRQFAERAVSAVDTEKRAEIAKRDEVAQTQDPVVSELKEAHDAAASAAESQAEAVVNALATPDESDTKTSKKAAKAEAPVEG